MGSAVFAIFWKSWARGGEVLVAQLPQERLFVPEVEVDGGRRVLDSLGDAAHRHGVVSLLGEELPRGVEDPRPQLLSLPLASFHSTQNVPPILNYVK